ncbi:hypothetical protein As57867_014006, partial [Aphanomyces stellatus]
IKPAMDYKIAEGDEIIVLAEDNDTYKAETDPVLVPPVTTTHPILPLEKVQEKVLVCGWRRDIQDMLVLLDNFVERGSQVHLVNELTMDERDNFLAASGVDMDAMENCTFEHHVGNTSVRRYLEPLPLESYTSIMVLCDFQRELDILNSDSHSLATVLLVRNLQKQRRDRLRESYFGPHVCEAISRWTRHATNKCPCITEILDPRTQKTVVANSTISNHSDFVMSNELISCMLAMISESREVKEILQQLLSPHSNTFTVQPSARYVGPHEVLSYMQLASRLVGVDELLVGYISKHNKTEAAVLNPKNKSAPKRWTHYDLIIITGGSTTHDKLTDVKRAVVGTIEDALRKTKAKPMLAALRKHGGPDDHTAADHAAKKRPSKGVGLVATQPPETRAMTRRSLTNRRLSKMAGSGSRGENRDIQITADVRRKLGLLNDEVQALLEQYDVRSG